ncbi:hypothetical protein BDF14DRAFT_1972195 [Spinellus fusiger]|nr:hypothetical protein BDF14DRAFT_1972195 [Spinellus fusiger]
MSYSQVQTSTYHDPGLEKSFFKSILQNKINRGSEHKKHSIQSGCPSVRYTLGKTAQEHVYATDKTEVPVNECNILDLSVTDEKHNLSNIRSTWKNKTYTALSYPQKKTTQTMHTFNTLDFAPRVQQRDNGKTPTASEHTFHQSQDPVFEMNSPCEPNETENIDRLYTVDAFNLAETLPPSFLSFIAQEFREKILLNDLYIKDNIEYKNVFDGEKAVDKLMLIIHEENRLIALHIGRSLCAQRFFHDVSYEKGFVDSPIEIYHFNDPDGSVNNYTCSPNNFYTRLPTGLLPQLTRCFNDISCYSYSCPKNKLQRDYRRSINLHPAIVAAPISPQIQSQQLWVSNVSPEILNSISNSEKKRQETIYELVYTEENFGNDLDYMNEMWIKPLTKEDIIPPSRRHHFIDKVFSNLLVIHSISSRLFKELQARQREHPIVSHIGDIMLKFATEFEPFIYYGARQYEAKFVFEQERYINPKLKLFAEKTERNPLSKKLELNGYLTKPTTRLGRYTLLLNEILKHTPPHHPDQTQIPEAMSTIRQFLARVNTETGNSKNKFDIERIHYHFTFKNNAFKVDLKLLEEGRSIIKQGTLRKLTHLNSKEYQIILFDHYLMFAKVKMLNNCEHYIICRKPIPLELLHVSTLMTPLVKQGSANLLSYIPKRESYSPSGAIESMILAGDYSATEMKSGYPLIFRQLGRKTSESVTFYAPSLATRKLWMDHIRTQQTTKCLRQPVFDTVSVLPERVFPINVKVNHIVTFQNNQLYGLATENGVYIGHLMQTSPPHRVLRLDHVAQIEVLEDYDLLLVLSDGVLWEYSIAVLNDTLRIKDTGRKVQAHVPFFHVGVCLERKLICVPQVSQFYSTIILLEPAPLKENRRYSLLEKIVKSKRNTGHAQFKRFKKVYVPSEAWALELTAHNLLITSPRGLVIIDMRSDKVEFLLNPNDKNLDFITLHKNDESRLNLRTSIKYISVFCTPLKEYLVCYNEYAFYVDKKGNRLYPNFLITWEGSPSSFAFFYPYVIAFEPSFIEVRSLITGNIEQIIQGDAVRCLNNGSTGEVPFIFGVKSSASKGTYQSIFQLKMSHSKSLSSSLAEL